MLLNVLHALPVSHPAEIEAERGSAKGERFLVLVARVPVAFLTPVRGIRQVCGGSQESAVNQN